MITQAFFDAINPITANPASVRVVYYRSKPRPIDFVAERGKPYLIGCKSIIEA